jgi:broad specificity phosphatase PhoE
VEDPPVVQDGSSFEAAAMTPHRLVLTLLLLLLLLASHSKPSRAFSELQPLHRFLLVRHGETNYNAEGRIQGTLESKLTERGHAQASEVGKWLASAEPAIDRIVVSPKLRTRETLAGIAAAHPGVEEAAAALRAGLREIELTGWEGRLRSDVTADPDSSSHPDADGERWRRWKRDPIGFTFDEDGHAPLGDMWQRAGEEWDSLKENALSATEPSTTLVVAHGALNRALVLHMLGLPVERWRDDKEHFLFDNCECVELRWSADGCGADDAPDDGPYPHAICWRRRFPQETPWASRAEEAARSPPKATL